MDDQQKTRRAEHDSVFRIATITLPGVATPLTGRVRDISAVGARAELVDGHRR